MFRTFQEMPFSMGFQIPPPMLFYFKSINRKQTDFQNMVQTCKLKKLLGKGNRVWI